MDDYLDWSLNYGKFKGVPLRYVPASYLEWVLKNVGGHTPTDLNAIRAALDAARNHSGRVYIGKRATKAILDVVDDVYRDLATRFHPDHRGGSNDAMIALNLMREAIVEQASQLAGTTLTQKPVAS